MLDVADELAISVLPGSDDPRVVSQGLVRGASHKTVPARVERRKRFVFVVLEQVVRLVGAQLEAENLPYGRPVPWAVFLDGVADAQLGVVVEVAGRHFQVFARVGGTVRILMYYQNGNIK